MTNTKIDIRIEELENIHLTKGQLFIDYGLDSFEFKQYILDSVIKAYIEFRISQDNPEIKNVDVKILTPADAINPAHYKGDTVMVFIETFELNFCLGNAVKYITRHKNKNGLEDLKKARWYLEREIARLENGK